MKPRLRKLALTAHVTSSVGWLGGVVVFLALAIAGLADHDGQTLRSTYPAMALTGWVVLVPLSLASLVTGLAQSLGTTWGLLRHYWVLVKLLMNVVATVVLLLYMRSVDYLADLAVRPTLSSGDVGVLQSPSPVLHAGAALVVLLVAVTLSVYKPRGLTGIGRRK